MSSLRRVAVAGRHYYIKAYEQAGRMLRKYIGTSRVRAEWQNLQYFRAIGVPTARVVAYGEQTGLPGPRKGVLVTEEIPGTIDLASLVKKENEHLADRDWLNCVARRLAGHVRTLHDHHFVHNDLKFRNVLVEFSPDPQVYIIDCPLGRRMHGPFLQRGVVKDLACLDKVAKYHFSKPFRMRFYKQYECGLHLDSRDKARLRRVLTFFEGRE
ncbi:MAG: protein kinase [Pseudomonadales bacterium]|nr:protein kinase [Pseudomonadales bacterium]